MSKSNPRHGDDCREEDWQNLEEYWVNKKDDNGDGVVVATSKNGAPPGFTNIQDAENLPAYTNDTFFLICLECGDAIAAGNLYKRLYCSHQFHEACLAEYISDNRRSQYLLSARHACPECRRDVEKGTIQNPDESADLHSQILAGEVLLRGEGKASLIGEKELFASYLIVDAPAIFKKRIEELSDYVACRRVKEDGNSFFRSFAFAYMEYIFESRDQKEATRMSKKLWSWEQIFRNVDPYLDFTSKGSAHIKTICLLLGHLSIDINGSDPSISYDLYKEQSEDQRLSDDVVKLFRDILHHELSSDRQFYENNLSEALCKSNVQLMGAEISPALVSVLSNALEVHVRIHIADNTSGYVHLLDSCVYSPRDTPREAGFLLIELLHRPGHYDILYPRGGLWRDEDLKGQEELRSEDDFS